MNLDDFNSLSLSDFKLLREARDIIKKEFDEKIKLSEENVLEKIINFGLESEDERLFEIVKILTENNDLSKVTRSKQRKVYRGAEIA